MPKSRPKSKINKEYIEQREKEAEALELVKQGFNCSEIAARLGYSGRQGAHRLIDRALKSLVEPVREEARAVCVARLDSWLTKLSDKIEEGDLKAIIVALKIEQRRAALLGLDAPVAVHNPNGGPLVSFVVQMPAQAGSVAEWQSQVIDVNAVPTPTLEDKGEQA